MGSSRRIRIATDESRGPRVPRDEAEEDPVRAESDHRDGVARSDPPAPHRLDGTRDGLGECTVLEGRRARKEQHVGRHGGCLDAYVLGEPARVESVPLPLGALDALARAAGPARPAGRVVMDDDSVARPESRTLPRFRNDAGGLVPEDGRGLRRDVPARRVAPADPDGLHRDEDLARSDRGNLARHDGDVVRSTHESGPHRPHGTSATLSAVPSRARAKAASHSASGRRADTIWADGMVPLARSSRASSASRGV